MAILDKIALTGTVAAVLAGSDRAAGLEKARAGRLELTFDGVVGDCHGGRVRDSDSRMVKQYARGTPVANTRQVSILSVEELADIAGRLGLDALPPEWVGANVVVSGIPDLTLIPPSTRLMFRSGACLIVDGENAPCRYVAEVIERHRPGHGGRFVEAARHRRGVVAWVEREGAIAEGDAIVLHVPPQRPWNHR